MKIAAGYEPTWHLRTPGAALVAALSLVFVAASAPPPAPLEVHKDERLFVIAPHPDDATLGAGGLIQQVLERGGTARDVLVTAGDGYVAAVAHEVGARRPCPAEYVAYGERRIREARAALRELGGPARLQLLGFPDGGIERLLHAHWQRTHPERSPTTGAEHPPYRNALRPSVAYDGADLEAELVQLLREGQPTLVALPDPLDRHPDHRAVGLFTLLALKEWTAEGGHLPRLVAYLVHWPDWPPGWNDAAPATAARSSPLTLPADLPDRGLERTTLSLTEREVTIKAAALARYQSQQKVLAPLLASFVRRTEPFTVLTGDMVQHIDEEIARGLHPIRHAADAPS